MKQPVSGANYSAYETEFERLRITSKCVDDFMLRTYFFRGLNHQLKSNLLKDKASHPIDFTQQDCMHDGHPWTLARLKALCAINVRHIVRGKEILGDDSARKRNSEAASETGGKNKKAKKGGDKNAKFHSTKGKSGKKGGKGSKGGTKGGPTTQSSGLFPKQKRIEAVKAKHGQNATEGANGLFADGTPKTCNSCNDPDHLAGDCPNGKAMSTDGNAGDAKAMDKLNYIAYSMKMLTQMAADNANSSQVPVDPSAFQAAGGSATTASADRPRQTARQSSSQGAGQQNLTPQQVLSALQSAMKGASAGSGTHQ
jgi:hypothetical protein